MKKNTYSNTSKSKLISGTLFKLKHSLLCIIIFCFNLSAISQISIMGNTIEAESALVISAVNGEFGSSGPTFLGDLVGTNDWPIRMFGTSGFFEFRGLGGQAIDYLISTPESELHFEAGSFTDEPAGTGEEPSIHLNTLEGGDIFINPDRRQYPGGQVHVHTTQGGLPLNVLDAIQIFRFGTLTTRPSWVIRAGSFSDCDDDIFTRHLELYYNSGTGTGNQIRGSFSNDDGDYCEISDHKLKNNIRPLINSIEKIKKLRPVTHSTTRDINGEKPCHRNAAFMGEEAIKIMPEAVTYDEKAEGYFISYQDINVHKIAAIQEQQVQIMEKSRRIETIEKELTVLKEKLKKELGEKFQWDIEKEEIEISNYLQQNEPNPFSEQTSIAYQLPENINSAEIKISNIDGKLVKRIALPIHENRSTGTIEIKATELKAGFYFYSLVIDGNVQDTKKMILNQ